MTTHSMKFTEAIAIAVGASPVDAEKGVIRNVKILGQTSENGRVYTDEAMKQAARLYEGMKVNIDHPDVKNRSAERSMRDRIGVLRNVKQKGSAVFGDLHILKTHPLAATIMEAADMMPETFGLSHHAHGQVRRDGETTIVETIERIHSVDLVQDPATNAGLFESLEPEKTVMKKTIAKILESASPKAKKSWQFARLLEMTQPEEGAAEEVKEMADEYADMPVDVPAEMSSEDAVKAAFKQAVIACLEDDSLTGEALKAKIAQLIDAGEAAAGSEVSEGDEPEEEEKPDMKESKNRTANGSGNSVELTEALERIKQLEDDKHDTELTLKCRDLLESKNREVTDVRVDALKRCDNDTSRRELIESWEKKLAGNERPSRSLGRNSKLLESETKYEATDGESLVKQLLR